jgi:hypothetical protein
MEDNFADALKDLEETFKAKNSDYGSAVDVTYLIFGETAQLVRLWDKLLRLTSIYLSQSYKVKEENTQDTLKDLANYAIIAFAQRNTYNGNPDELGIVVRDFIKKAKGGSKCSPQKN